MDLAEKNKQLYKSIPGDVYSKPYLPLCQQVWKMLLNMGWTPTPAQTIDHKLPDYKTWRFRYDIPDGPRIHYEDLGLTFTEACNGFLTDINWETKPPFERSNLISIGHGIESKIIKKDE